MTLHLKAIESMIKKLRLVFFLLLCQFNQKDHQNLISDISLRKSLSFTIINNFLIFHFIYFLYSRLYQHDDYYSKTSNMMIKIIKKRDIKNEHKNH